MSVDDDGYDNGYDNGYEEDTGGGITSDKYDKDIATEVKARLVSFLDGKFVLTLLVFLVCVVLLTRGYLEHSSFATIITGGIFAYDITRNESYSEIILEKIEDKIN